MGQVLGQIGEFAPTYRFSPALGLAPRYLRERRSPTKPSLSVALTATLDDLPGQTADEHTPELRRRVLAAAPEFWRRRSLIGLSLLLAASAALWLCYDCGVTGHLLGAP